MYVQTLEDPDLPTITETQGQLLASQLVLNALLDEFSNIDSIYISYKATIR